MARNTADPKIKQQLALIRRAEAQQQKAINWLIPGDESTLEVTIGYEQVAVDLTAWIAQHEPDAYLRQIYEFGLLEDFDHLYPLARKELEEADLIDEADVEHAAAKQLIAEIEGMSPRDKLFEAKVKVLGEYVKHHVNEEENELFPKMRETDLDFYKLGERLAARKMALLIEARA
jgi:hypothetical protein